MNNIFTYNPENDDFSIVMFEGHSANLNAMNNYFGSDIATEIATTITDSAVNPDLGTVTFQPFLNLADINFNPPQNLTAKPFNQRVVLTWEKPEWSHGILEGYRVYRNDVAVTGLIQNIEFTDTDVVNGTTYSYHVKAIYTIQTGVSAASNTATATPSDETSVDDVLVPCSPDKTSLANVFPNPMRVNTVSNFEIEVKEGETASFTIFNIRGQLVHKVNDIVPGNHRISWNGRDKNDREVASGVYFYRLSSPSFHTVQRMVIVR